MSVLVLAFVLACSPQAPALANGSLQPVALRCEHHRGPLGIDAPKPVLSWRLVAAGSRTRGLQQTAYQVRVASTAELLGKDTADLWDSKQVASPATADIEYEGQPLTSGQRCWWQVRAWDQDGVPGPWSATASWGMGLLSPSDWQAQWIGDDAPLDARDRGPDLDGATWLWANDEAGKPLQGELHFRGHWALPAKWDRARLFVTGDNTFELWLNGALVGKSDGHDESWRRAVAFDVTKALQPGDNVVAAVVANRDGPGGLIAKLVVETGDTQQVFTTEPGWRQTAKAADGWQQPKFDDAAWSKLVDAGKYGAGPWGRLESGQLFLPPPRVLSKSFMATAAPVRATLYASALGLYEIELNGKKVGDAFFTPGWTDYEQRVYYQAYDVTAAVHAGANQLQALLADGWHSGYVGYGLKRDHYGEHTRLLAQLVLEAADGTRQIVATDGSWTATTGSTREADFLMGETCDMTFAPPAPKPVVVSTSKAVLQSHPGEAVRVIEERKPCSIKQCGDDVYVCDLGQNIAGFVRLQLQGKRGQKITLRFAERRNPDGTVYTQNLRQARCVDTYVCAGTGVEIWQPRFTFHGFQYVEVKGLGQAPTQDTITGVAVSSDTPMLGDFQCSEPMVDQLVSNIRWTQRMNFIDIPTDCPQRDERLGWTGDAQAYIRTATCLADTQAFYGKWLVDLTDAQRADGQFPMVAPLKVAGGDGGPAWADAGVICPWNVYEVYGDRRLLARQYPSMVRFVEFCRDRCSKELAPPARFHCFGDWLNIDDETPHAVIFTAYFAHSTQLVARSAAALGKMDDARKFDELAARARAYFEQTCVEPDGQLRGHSQTAYVLALAFDLLSPLHRAQAAQHLVAHLQARKWHLATGFVGTKDLMLVLDKIGRNDVAYRLLANTDFPSWGFCIVHGATSIWERWNGWTPEKGFNDPGMNSFAHYAFGAVGEWLFEVPGGIRTDGPGYRRIVIAPQPGGALTWVRVRQPTVHGEVAAAWKLDGERVLLDVTVPPNTTALVRAPTADPASITVDGVPAAQAAGVQVRDGGVCEVGSGQWSFAAQRR